MFSPFCSKAHPDEAPYSAIPTPLAGDALGSGGGGIFKQAAVEVLRAERRLMPTGEIARLALLRGLVRATGKTPEATMASALYTDIKRREGTSIFIRPHEGLFGLREWLELGIEFRDDYSEELARRAAATYGPYSALGLAPGAGFHPAGLVPTSLGARTPPCEAAGPSSASGGSGGLMDLLDAAEMELKRCGRSCAGSVYVGATFSWCQEHVAISNVHALAHHAGLGPGRQSGALLLELRSGRAIPCRGRMPASAPDGRTQQRLLWNLQQLSNHTRQTPAPRCLRRKTQRTQPAPSAMSCE